MNLNKSIIGMVHVQALPGTPQNKYSILQICDMAVEEVRLYADAGVDAIMIENMHDIPYLKESVGPEIVASMSVVAKLVREATDLDLGIQILAGANKEALAVAQAANFQFIRAEGFVFGHLADEGYMESCAGELLRYRKAIGAEAIEIYTDIKKKHSSHAITADVDIDETAKTAEFFLSDGLIITGSSTGKAVYLHELKSLKDKVHTPILIGSGITVDNLAEYWNYANAFIVGSHFKEGGYWKNSVSAERLKHFMKKVEDLRIY